MFAENIYQSIFDNVVVNYGLLSRMILMSVYILKEYLHKLITREIDNCCLHFDKQPKNIVYFSDN